MKNSLLSVCLLFLFMSVLNNIQTQRPRDLGIQIGVMPTGENNAITDVPGVKVGHHTLIIGNRIRTGVTAILPHQGNIFQQKIPAAIFLGNGFGKLAGYSQVKELGNLETPIILTNTLSVPVAVQALMKYTLGLKGNEDVRSVNPVVGETNDGRLNDIRGMHVKEEHIFEAIKNAKGGRVKEGNIGAGTGTVCFGYKGGIGTSSRKLPSDMGAYTVGVLVQTNFGGVLQIDGVPIAKLLGNYPYKNSIEGSIDGSCMIIVLTDAPIVARNLERLAKRALLGLGKTGGIMSNGSGDYVVAGSTNTGMRIPYNTKSKFQKQEVLRNDAMSPLFLAVIEATEEAIINSLFAAEDMEGNKGSRVKALPVKKIMKMIKKYKSAE